MVVVVAVLFDFMSMNFGWSNWNKFLKALLICIESLIFFFQVYSDYSFSFVFYFVEFDLLKIVWASNFIEQYVCCLLLGNLIWYSSVYLVELKMKWYCVYIARLSNQLNKHILIHWRHWRFQWMNLKNIYWYNR